MIPTYPDLARIDIKHARKIRAFTSQFRPYSDFNFVSMFCWDIANNVEISMLNNNLVIILPDYVNATPVVSILGKNKMDSSLDTLLGDNAQLKLIPKIVVSNIKHPKKFSIVEDRDNHDYIYSSQKLYYLSGGALKKKRYKLNSFKKAYEGTIVTKMHRKLDAKLADSMLNLFGLWEKESSQSDEEIALEKTAFKNFIKHVTHFDIFILTVYINNILVAFSIMEIVGKKYGIVHFEKALKIHEHLSVFVASESAKVMLYHDVNYINWEQDLGIEGLRKSKISFKPDKFLKKYVIKK